MCITAVYCMKYGQAFPERGKIIAVAELDKDDHDRGFGQECCGSAGLGLCESLRTA